MRQTNILLFGTGPMAYEYSKVLKAQGCKFLVVGRGQKSAEIFRKQTGVTPIIGGTAKFLSTGDYSSHKAIIAVSGDQLGTVALSLIKHGIKSILLEKPGGSNEKEIKLVNKMAKKYSSKVFIAYNRRFYTSTRRAQEIIKKDGGVLSFHFEFNEPFHAILKYNYPKKVKDNWLLHNSTHVIDLAFFLGGIPKVLSAWTLQNRIFVGWGVSKPDVPFTYHANWLTPGRWGVEIMTKNHRLIFRPLEKLKVQKNDSFEIFNITLNDEFDTEFKPGLFKEVESFLTNTPGKNYLCSINKHTDNLLWYHTILKGN